MALRRGFKADANAIALQCRRELNLDPIDPLCPWAYARYLGVPLRKLSEIPEIEEQMRILHGQAWREFSGVVVGGPHYDQKMIVYNETHSIRRQASTIAHELSHVILEHPHGAFEGSVQVLEFGEPFEEEAKWLGPALLISEEAALHIAETEMSEQAAIDHYGVSQDLLQMRMKVTPAQRRVQRKREKELREAEGTMTDHLRLKGCRERLGYTQLQVSELIKIPRETLSVWENGKRSPQPQNLKKLAKIYQVPLSYLQGRGEFPKDKERESLLGEISDPEAKSQVNQWLDFLDRWAEFLQEQGHSFERYETPKPLDRGMVEDIRRASTWAVGVRRHYDLGLDGICDLYGFLDRIGVLVYRASLGNYSQLGSELITGAHYNHPQLGWCILVNTDTSPGRQIFTLAHELAHVLYHYSAMGKICMKSQDSDPKERFADAFACHFLVPRKTLHQQLKRRGRLDPYKVMRLAASFQVSYATMLMRLMEEKAIGSGEVEEWKTFSPLCIAEQLGLSPMQFETTPLDRYPLSVRDRVREALRSEQISLGQAAQLLQVQEEELSTWLKPLTRATPEELQEFDELPS